MAGSLVNDTTLVPGVLIGYAEDGKIFTSASAKAAAQRQVQEQEHKRLRTREESFEDELRAMELEERRLELQAKRARAARANDYIDAELRDSAARTDVIQSDTDATRNVTSGAKALLEDTGAAEVNRSKRLFE